MADTVWRETRGTGRPAVVLLHGLNGTAALWDGVDKALAERVHGQRILLDMPGHGRSARLSGYSLGAMTAAVAATLVDCTEPVYLAGHSMGGAVALALASGWFGLPVRGVFALGVKTDWSTEERAHAATFARKPPRVMATRDDAESFLLRASGLGRDAEVPGFRATGVVREGKGFRIAADPAATALGATWHDSVIAAIRPPFRLASGEHDSMVSTESLARFGVDVVELAGAGHNAHVDHPEATAAAIAEHIAAVG